VYPVISDPPLSTGAVNVISAPPVIPVASPIVGASGVVVTLGTLILRYIVIKATVFQASVTTALTNAFEDDTDVVIATPANVPPVSVIPNSVESTDVPFVCTTSFEDLVFVP
jgi:hypothetical protein